MFILEFRFQGLGFRVASLEAAWNSTCSLAFVSCVFVPRRSVLVASMTQPKGSALSRGLLMCVAQC